MFRISDQTSYIYPIFEWFSDKTIEQDQFFPNFGLNIHFANLVSNHTKTLRVFFCEFIKNFFSIFSRKTTFRILGNRTQFCCEFIQISTSESETCAVILARCNYRWHVKVHTCITFFFQLFWILLCKLITK